MQPSLQTAPNIPDNPAGPIRASIFVIFMFIGGFLLWAMTASLASAVIAHGSIKVDGSRKQIQNLEGGIVEDILVRNGDEVRAGQVLVKLDETRAAASLAILQDSWYGLMAERARLIAERDGLEVVSFPDSTNMVSEQRVQELIDAQNILFDARKVSILGQVEILHSQIKHLEEDVVGLRAQRSAKYREIGHVKDELESHRTLYSKKIVGKQRMLELERELAELQGERGEIASKVAAAQTAINEKELEIYQVKKAMREKVVDELKKVQSEIYDLEERVNSAQHVLKQARIISPVDGIVVGSDVHTVGGIINPGETILEIVPSQDRLIIEAKVNPQDIDDVHIGLPARVKMTAFNQRRTPELDGEVIYVSADSMEDERTGETYFFARVEVTEDELARLGDSRIQPGMFAEVFITTGERTPAEYLMQPLRDSFRRAWLEKD